MGKDLRGKSLEKEFISNRTVRLLMCQRMHGPWHLLWHSVKIRNTYISMKWLKCR